MDRRVVHFPGRDCDSLGDSGNGQIFVDISLDSAVNRIVNSLDGQSLRGQCQTIFDPDLYKEAL